MRKINFLYPAIFLIALTGSAFTQQSSLKARKFGVSGFYQDPYGYCDGVYVDDPNCSPYWSGPVCQEYIMDDGTGWTTIFEFGVYSTCYEPMYSLYANNP